MKYIDLYFLPVPADKLQDYLKQANAFGKIVVEYGALAYREFQGDDLGDGNASFLTLTKPQAGHLVTTAIAEFDSKQHRDQVMEKVMADQRVKNLLAGPEIADMQRMIFGGFEQIVDGKN